MKAMTLVLLLLATLTGVTACDREGPLERAGEEADEAGRELKDATRPEPERR